MTWLWYSDEEFVQFVRPIGARQNGPSLNARRGRTYEDVQELTRAVEDLGDAVSGLRSVGLPKGWYPESEADFGSMRPALRSAETCAHGSEVAPARSRA